MKHTNTLKKGSVRFIIFREEGACYGACLEFNIVESGDTPQEAMLLLFEAIQGYLESAKKIKARPHILNQKADPEYESLWVKLEEAKQSNRPPSVFSHGQIGISEIIKDRIPVTA